MHYNEIPVVSYGFVLPKDQYLCETLVAEELRLKFKLLLEVIVDCWLVLNFKSTWLKYNTYEKCFFKLKTHMEVENWLKFTNFKLEMNILNS